MKAILLILAVSLGVHALFEGLPEITVLYIGASVILIGAIFKQKKRIN